MEASGVTIAQKWGRRLTILASLTLAVRRGIIRPYTLQPFEIITAAAALFTVTHFIIKKELPDRKITFWSALFSILILLLAGGFLRSASIYEMNASIIIATLKDFYFLAAGMLIFLLAMHYGNDVTFRKNMVLSFLTPLLFSPLLFFPALWAEKEFFTTDIYFLAGLHQNPIIFAAFTLIAIICLTVFLINEGSAVKKFIYWLSIVILLSLLLWTASRGALLAMAAAAVFIISFKACGYDKKRAIRFIVAAGAIFLITASISFALLHQETRIAVLYRFFPQIADYDYLGPAVMRQIKLGEAIKKIAADPIPALPAQNRLHIWPQALRLFLKQPLGLGPEYWRASGLISQNVPVSADVELLEEKTTTAHNSFLEIALSGGVGALIIFSFLIFTLVRKITLSLQKDDEWLILSSAFLGLFIITFLNGVMQNFPWFWIIAGLIFAKK